MNSKYTLWLAGWLIAIAGLALVVWQAALGGGSDRLYNIGLVALIVGTVLRLYARYGRAQPTGRPEQPGIESRDKLE